VAAEIKFDIFNSCFDESGLKKVDLARALGVNTTTLQAWFDREKVPTKYLYPISDVLDVNPKFLIGEAEDAQKMQAIYIIGRSDESAVPSMPLLTDGLPHIERPFLGDDVYGIILCGNAMTPTIQPCATCICNPHAKIAEGDIVHYSYGDQNGIRRYRLSADKRTIVLIGDNPDTDPLFISWDTDKKLEMSRVVAAEIQF